MALKQLPTSNLSASPSRQRETRPGYPSDFAEEARAANDRVYRSEVPELCADNAFMNEYKFIKAPFNKVSQKYNILYQVLAPKLLAKKSLVNSKMQADALEVLGALAAPSTARDKSSSYNGLMPTGAPLPLRQDIENLLALYTPLHAPPASQILQRNINPSHSQKAAAKPEEHLKEYDYNSDDSDDIDQISDENHTYQNNPSSNMTDVLENQSVHSRLLKNPNLIQNIPSSQLSVKNQMNEKPSLNNPFSLFEKGAPSSTRPLVAAGKADNRTS